MRRAGRALLVVAPLAALSLEPAVARAQMAPPEAPAAPTPRPADANEAALRRVLRSGCRDGLSEVRALAASDATPWAVTVARLCDEILRAPTAPAVNVPAAPAARGEQSGRGTIVSASTLYGIWVGIAADVMFKVDGARSAVLPPLLGMAAGLGLSLAATSEHPIDNGQAWSIITGLEYGSLDGAFWALGADAHAQAVVSAALVTGVGGGVIGLVVGDKLDPAQGDVEVVRSGLLWGTAAGMLSLAAFSSGGGSAAAFFRGSAVAMDLGFLGGLGFAGSFDLSRNRVLIIDAGTLGGLVAGGGVTWLATAGPNQVHWRAVAGGALAGMTLGMVATILLSRHMDDAGYDAGPAVSALWGRDARGRWGWDAPEPTPVLDGLGRRVIGASLTAVGGTF